LAFYGRHEIKYGWHLDYSTFDLERYYSGPPGDRALIQLVPNGGPPYGIPYSHVNSQSFYRLQPGQYPADFGPGDSMSRFPLSDRVGPSFLDSSNLGPRFGVVYDPFNDGRSKISAGYGRYYESIPMNIAARYFGGESFVTRGGVPSADCMGNENLYSWTGAGE